MFTAMLSVAKIEPDIVTEALSTRVDNFMMFEAEEKEKPIHKFFFEDILKKGVGYQLDERGCNILIDFWIDMEQGDKLIPVLAEMKSREYKVDQEMKERMWSYFDESGVADLYVKIFPDLAKYIQRKGSPAQEGKHQLKKLEKDTKQLQKQNNEDKQKDNKKESKINSTQTGRITEQRKRQR